MNVAPLAGFEAVIDTGTTGLLASIGVSVNDNQGATTVAFTLADTELAPGVYVANLTAPDTQGQYTLIWRDGAAGTVQGIEDLVVTSSAPADALPVGPAYVTTDELFRVLNINNPSAARTAAGERVLTAAKVEIDSIMGRSEDLTAEQLQLAAEVNLERAEELWADTEKPYGAMLGGDVGVVFAPRRSRALAKLLPLKQKMGIA